MSKHAHDGESDRVDAAFNRVLAAEARVREQVEACRGQAAAILAAAEEQLRRIRDRTDERVRRAHRIADEGVERALGELRAASAHPECEALSADTLARLERAVQTLVEEILAPEAGEHPETRS